MINYNQFREHIVIPVLKYLEPEIPFSEEAVDLLMMTCAHESKGGTFLKQINGPALGVYQMEPDTHRDIWDNFLGFRSGLNHKCFRLINDAGYGLAGQMVYDFQYATAMARVHYYRVPLALPTKAGYTEHEYLSQLASYAKTYYNTELGKAKSIDYYRDFIEWRDS